MTTRYSVRAVGLKKLVVLGGVFLLGLPSLASAQTAPPAINPATPPGC